MVICRAHPSISLARSAGPVRVYRPRARRHVRSPLPILNLISDIKYICIGLVGQLLLCFPYLLKRPLQCSPLMGSRLPPCHHTYMPSMRSLEAVCCPGTR